MLNTPGVLQKLENTPVTWCWYVPTSIQLRYIDLEYTATILFPICFNTQQYRQTASISILKLLYYNPQW